MAYNQLNLFFGPALPQEFDHVGLAFIAAPTLQSDSAIGALSAIRYAKENYDHVEPENIFELGFAQAKLDVSYGSTNIKALGNTTGGFNANGRVILDDDEWGPKILNSAIKVAGMQISPAGTWCPIIKPGIVYRANYTVAASGIEPTHSWLKRALDPNNENDKDYTLMLVYTIPEVMYTSNYTGDVGLAFPPSEARYKLMSELASPTGPNTISYNGEIDVLKSITINGTLRASGTYIGTEVGTGVAFFRSIDKTTKQIHLKSAVGPDDVVELKYYSYNDFYIYTGFRDVSGYWYPFDANPEFGHFIGNDQTHEHDLSSDALLRQITLYAIPSAAIIYDFKENPSGSESIGVLTMTAIRAIDYGETHYVRHLISSEPIESIDSRDGGTVINTWGHAIFGRNFYDEDNRNSGDIFNLTVPAMLPLGRFVLGAPAAVNSISMADIRERGGGVPVDFTMEAVESTSDGLDKLRGFFDLGIWEGKAIKEGGVLEVQIDTSLLKTDPDDTNPSTFLGSEIYEIVKNQVPPGIDFEIKYV